MRTAEKLTPACRLGKLCCGRLLYWPVYCAESPASQLSHFICLIATLTATSKSRATWEAAAAAITAVTWPDEADDCGVRSCRCQFYHAANGSCRIVYMVRCVYMPKLSLLSLYLSFYLIIFLLSLSLSFSFSSSMAVIFALPVWQCSCSETEK